MTLLADLLARDGVAIIYDGECPFCSAYVRMLRLRESAGRVEMIDARQAPALVGELAGRNLQVDREMVVLYGGRIHAGGDAVHTLALLTSPSGALNRLVAGLLKNPRRARWLYPYLRGARNLALRLLGRPPIG